MPPVLPMLAKSVKAIPAGGGYLFEPKWDGFRCLVFKDGDEVELTSRNTKPLTRYFPEVVEALRTVLPGRCVLDGELVVAADGRLQFDLLQERIHPAESRVRMLAEATPASYVAFDLLALRDDDLTWRPQEERRALLEQALAGVSGQVHLTRVSRDVAEAQRWFEQFEGAGLDGVVAKPLDAAYQPNVRAMLKIKHDRTADVVVAGYRWHKNSTPEAPLLGSLLLGLYDDEGNLRHLGVAASFTAARRAALVEELAPLVCEPHEHPWGRWQEVTASGGKAAQANVSRWNAGKDLSFVLLRPTLVAEVGYDHLEGDRFRHTAQFQRWRPDRDPESCTYDQLDEPVSYDLDTVLGR